MIYQLVHPIASKHDNSSSVNIVRVITTIELHWHRLDSHSKPTSAPPATYAHELCGSTASK